MDYEKKYKEALEWARKVMHGKVGFVLDDVLEKFPELKESEDEKVIKWLTDLLSTMQYHHCDEDMEMGNKAIAWLKKQCEQQDKGEISDGYHTFNELYYYRLLYNAAFFNMLPKEWVHKSKKHNDGEECFGGGWFIVMANLPTGQISNHYELKDWNLFQIPEKEVADKWDGHTPQEAADRLHKYLLEKQGEQKPVEERQYTRKIIDTTTNEVIGYQTDDGLFTPETRPAWSEEDELMLTSIIQTLKLTNGAAKMKIDWLNSLKDRVQPQLKQEWSEEEIETCAREAEDNNCIILAKHIRQLKSLKERYTWKPSDEQMRDLQHIVLQNKGNALGGNLNTLLEQLKKL